MRKFGIALALVAALVAAWATTSTATTSKSAISNPKMFSLLSVTTQDLPINVFAFQRAPVAGDQFGFAETLYKWAGTKRGARVGRLLGLSTFMTVGANGGTMLTVVHAHLPGGTVLLQGIIHFPYGPTTFTLPVVGGTGIYDNVRGYVIVRNLGDGNQARTTPNSTCCRNPFIRRKAPPPGGPSSPLASDWQVDAGTDGQAKPHLVPNGLRNVIHCPSAPTVAGTDKPVTSEVAGSSPVAPVSEPPAVQQFVSSVDGKQGRCRLRSLGSAA